MMCKVCMLLHQEQGSHQEGHRLPGDCWPLANMERERKSTLVKAQEKKSGTDSSRGAIRKDVKALLSPIDSSPERTSVRIIRRQERRALGDPNYARNKLISTLANTDPGDLFPSGAPEDLLDDDLQSEAGPPVSPTPLIRRTLSSRKPRQRPKMLLRGLLLAAETRAPTVTHPPSELGTKPVGPLVPTR